MKLQTFKCTFTDKKVSKFNDQVTIVTFKGYIRIPWDLYCSITSPIAEWIHTQKQVEISEDLTPCFHFQVSGKALRNEEDEDGVLGERLADSRAKAKLYNFCRKFLEKMSNEYMRFIIDLAKFKHLYADRYTTEQEHIKELLEC